MRPIIPPRIDSRISSAWGQKQYSGLDKLCSELRELPEIKSKRPISSVSNLLGDKSDCDLTARYGLPGDDCAAFPMGDGFQLLAMEGMLPQFVATDARAAGWSSVMVNVSDIAAMGGRATAIVNAYWHNNQAQADELLYHIKRACDVFGVGFSGGHTSVSDKATPGLAVAITGYAKKLLSCYHVKAGQRLFLVTDLTGSWHGDLPYWGCVQGKSNKEIRNQWQIPAELAEKGLVEAAKDISNGGILGTLIMMLELTGCGATLDLNAIPKPDDAELLRWLRAFQSFGFLLAVDVEKTGELISFFNRSHLSCAPVGEINDTGKIILDATGTRAEFWDVVNDPLTALGN